jgi:hypothetical protein
MLSFEYPATAVREDAVIITVAQGFTTASCPKPILQGILPVQGMCFAKMGMVTIQLRIIY